MDLDKAWAIAGEAGLDVRRARQASRAAKITAVLNQDMADVQAVGVKSTPTFFVNGRKLLRFSESDLRALIDDELKK